MEVLNFTDEQHTIFKFYFCKGTKILVNYKSLNLNSKRFNTASSRHPALNFTFIEPTSCINGINKGVSVLASYTINQVAVGSFSCTI